MRCFDVTPVLIPVAVLVFLMALHTEISFSPFRISFHNWRMVVGVLLITLGVHLICQGEIIKYKKEHIEKIE